MLRRRRTPLRIILATALLAASSACATASSPSATLTTAQATGASTSICTLAEDIPPISFPESAPISTFGPHPVPLTGGVSSDDASIREETAILDTPTPSRLTPAGEAMVLLEYAVQAHAHPSASWNPAQSITLFGLTRPSAGWIQIQTSCPLDIPALRAALRTPAVRAAAGRDVQPMPDSVPANQTVTGWVAIPISRKVDAIVVSERIPDADGWTGGVAPLYRRAPTHAR